MIMDAYLIAYGGGPDKAPYSWVVSATNILEAKKHIINECFGGEYVYLKCSIVFGAHVDNSIKNPTTLTKTFN